MAYCRLNLLWALFGFPLALATLLNRLMKRKQTLVQLKDKVVLITGASSGLGEACAELFHTAGCKLILSGRQVQKLLDLRDYLMTRNSSGHIPSIVTMDFENLQSLPGKVKDILNNYQSVDILINNAGMSYRGNAEKTSIDVDMKLMAVNYFGHIAITKALLPAMIQRGSGHIVAIGSVQGLISIPNRTAYAASKHALQAYFDSLRAEVSLYNIDVSVISPYYIKTNLSINAVTGDGSTYGKMDKTTQMGLDPLHVAQEVLECVKHKKDEVVLAPFHIQIAICMKRLAPWIFFKIMASRARKEAAEVSKDR